MVLEGAAHEVLERLVPERTVAVVAREVRQGQVASFIDEGFTALLHYRASRPGALPDHATEQWPLLAEYFGPLSADVPALVELCAVVDTAATPVPGVAVRVEPAHREAYSRVTKAGLRFPAVLDVYAQLAGWVADRGHMVGSLVPREIYVADVRVAAPDDLVCDIAIPFVPAP